MLESSAPAAETEGGHAPERDAAVNLSVARAHGEVLEKVMEHCRLDHYLHRWPSAKSLPFAYALEIDGSPYAPNGWWLNGLVVMKKAQHLRQRGLFGYPGLPTAWQVLDLARVWVGPHLQHKENGHSLCIFSQMVSRVLKRVQWDWVNEVHPPRYPDQPYHIEVIISYCDLSHHDGTAYRASGFKWHGYSESKSKEVYVRHLKAPLKQWRPQKPVQIPLFSDMGLPLIHS